MQGQHDERERAVSLVMPAYNEAAVIERAVEEARAALAKLCSTFEIIVVDDGSSDGTAAILRALSKRVSELRVIRHRSNRGYGAALTSGFRAARFPWVAFTDADCQFDLQELGRLLEHRAADTIVVGRRLGRKDPWLRRFLSWGYNQLVRWLLRLPVRDVDCALKVYPRELVRRLLPRSPGYFVNTEMLARATAKGVAIREVAVSHRPRAGGKSKVGLHEVPRTAFTLVRFCWEQWQGKWKRRWGRLRRRQAAARVWSAHLPVPLDAGIAAPKPQPVPSSGLRRPIGPVERHPEAV